MIGGWQLYIKQRERAMFGRRRDGFQIEEEFIIATIAVTILEHKENFGFARFFFDRDSPFVLQRCCPCGQEMQHSAVMLTA